LINIVQTGGGKGKGDSTSWGSAFFGSVTKGLCNNDGKGKVQDCTVLAGRVGVMWADGSNRIADPSTGMISWDYNTKPAHNADITNSKGSTFIIFSPLTPIRKRHHGFPTVTLQTESRRMSMELLEALDSFQLVKIVLRFVCIAPILIVNC
jgi:hypothetical protein